WPSPSWRSIGSARMAAEEGARGRPSHLLRRFRAFAAEPHQLDALARGGEGEPAVLEIERVLAEELVAPAVERAHAGVVVGGDALEIIAVGDELHGDVVLLAAQP